MEEAGKLSLPLPSFFPLPAHANFHSPPPFSPPPFLGLRDEVGWRVAVGCKKRGKGDATVGRWRERKGMQSLLWS